MSVQPVILQDRKKLHSSIYPYLVLVVLEVNGFFNGQSDRTSERVNEKKNNYRSTIFNFALKLRPSTNRPGNHQQRHTGRLLLRLKADRFGCIDKDQEYHLNNHALTVKDMEQIEDSFTEDEMFALEVFMPLHDCTAEFRNNKMSCNYSMTADAFSILQADGAIIAENEEDGKFVYLLPGY